MLVDLHTHTQPLSHDSALTADDLIEAAREAGLDAVCLTEHDFAWDPEAVRDLARRHDFPVIAGIEVNTEDGHFLAFGLPGYVYGMHRTEELARHVRDAGGVLIAAHPYRRQLPFELLREGDWSGPLERAAANPAYSHVLAVESLNGRGTERENAFSEALRERLALPAIAASDAHSLSDLGRVATEFDADISDLESLIAALRSGAFRPVRLS